jgi:D-3-phosphoglycerate dehydrogenase
MPSVSDDVLAQVGPYITLGEMLGNMHMQLASGGVQEISIEYGGGLADLDTKSITVAFLKGLFTPILKDAVNYVNAPIIARDRGIKVVESRTDQASDFINTLVIKVSTVEGENELVGTVFGKNEPRLVRLNNFRLEALPSGPMLLVYNNDVPGVIGALGTELGRSGINISRMTVGREAESRQNIIFLGTDQLISKEILERVRAIENINGAQSFDL